MIHGKKGIDCLVSMLFQVLIFFVVLPFCFMQQSVMTFLFGLIVILVDVFYLCVSFNMFEDKKVVPQKLKGHYRKK